MFAWREKNRSILPQMSVAGAVASVVLANLMLCAAIPAIALAPPVVQDKPMLSDYAGKWVRKVRGQNFLVLTLKVAGDQVSGSLVLPKRFNEAQGGEVDVVNPEVARFTVARGSVLNGHLEFVTEDVKDAKDQAHHVMTLVDHDRASMKFRGWEDLAPWKLQRVSESAEVSVATSWPDRDPKVVSPEIAALQVKLRQMVAEDQAADAPPYSDFGNVCEKNYPEVVRIYEQYGWPRISIVGESAASNFWLLAVHQTEKHLDFAKRALQDMKRAVDAGEASEANWALFYDKVLVYEGKPQHWGTSTTCKDGKRVLYPVDDADGLDQRRRDLQMQPVGNYLKELPPCEK